MGELPDPKMSGDQIWHLIETADNFLKYRGDPASVDRARKRLNEALEAATDAGIEPLADLARKRLEDLKNLEG